MITNTLATQLTHTPEFQLATPWRGNGAALL